MAFYPRARVVLSVLLEDFQFSSENLQSFEVIPRSIEWTRNGHREADAFKLEVDYRDFPFDPRTLRSVRIEIFAGDVGDPKVRLPIDAQRFRRFSGYADEPEAHLEEGGETVRMQGRDYTGIFLDFRWPGTTIDITRPLSRIVDEIVATVPGADGILRPAFDGANEILSKRIGKTLWTPQNNDDAWTILVGLCAIVGLLPVIELDRLLILTPGQFGANRTSFVYGRNVSKLAYKRKLHEARTAQVKVVSWDPCDRVSREAIFPKEPIILRQRVSTKGKVTKEAAPIIPFFVEGPYKIPELEKIAQSIYERSARNQIEGSLTTRDMDDGAVGVGADVLALANGDRLDIRLGKQDPSDIMGLSEAEAVAFLTRGRNGLLPAVARALVRSWKQAESLATTFYVKTARHRWDRDQGYALDANFINFVDGGGGDAEG